MKTLQTRANRSLTLTLFLIWLSFPGGPFPWLGWVVLAPLVPALAGISATAGAAVGALFGFFGWLISSWWLAPATVTMADTTPLLAWLVVIVLAAASALPYALFGYLAVRLNLFGERPRAITAAAIWSLLVFVTPSVFPGSVATSQYRYPLLIQITEVGGVPLLHFIMAMCSFSLGASWLRKRHPRESCAWFMTATTLFLITVSYGYHALEQWGQKAAGFRSVTVGIVQPNLPVKRGEEALHVDPADRGNDLSTAFNLTEQLVRSEPDLAFAAWPEMPIAFSPTTQTADEQRMREFTSLMRKPLLVSAVHYTNELIDGRPPFYNAVQLYQGGHKPERQYFKNILIPFGEYLPFESFLNRHGLEQVLPELRRYTAGTEQELFSIGEALHVATPVCLELIYSSYVGGFIERGANLIVNPSDDAYFGRSRGAEMHLSLAVFRAIEFRTPVVRVTNSGMSGVIDHLGQFVPGSTIGLFETGARAVKVRVPERGRMNYPHRFTLFVLLLTLVAGGVNAAFEARTEESGGPRAAGPN